MNKVLPIEGKEMGLALAFPNTWFQCYKCGGDYLGVYPHGLFYCKYCRWLEKND